MVHFDGTHSRLNSATGMFNIQSDDFRVTDAANSLTAFKIDPDGATDLRYNGSVKLQTTTAGIDVTGDITATGNLSITSAAPQIFLTDSNANSDYAIVVNTGQFRIRDETNSANRLAVNSDGHVDIYGRLDAQGGLEVTGDITATGDVGIGITSIASSTRLALSESSGNAQTLEIIAANNGGVGSQPGIKFTNSSGGNTGGIFADTNSGEVRLQTGGTPRLVINSSGIVGINNTGTVYGQLNVGMPSQSGGAALQVMNSSSGSGDNSLTNIVLRSVNSNANNWSHAQYKASSHQFLYQGTTKVNINSNGLCFNGDTAAANALDDYEEGIWTVTVASGGVIANQLSARYTKIGRMVHYQFYINMGTMTSTSTFTIGGLPYTASSNSQYFYGTGRINGQTFVALQINATSNGGHIYISGGTTLKFNAASNAYVLISGVYEAD